MSEKYRIFETVSFVNDLSATDQSPEVLKVRLRQFVYPQLRRLPFFGPNIRRLLRTGDPLWRYRVGDWLFYYRVDQTEDIVYMIAAEIEDGHDTTILHDS